LADCWEAPNEDAMGVDTLEEDAPEEEDDWMGTGVGYGFCMGSCVGSSVGSDVGSGVGSNVGSGVGKADYMLTATLICG